MDNFSAHSSQQRNELLEKIKLSSVEQLFDCIPKEVRVSEFNLPDGLSELDVQKKIKTIASKNKTNYISFLGGGVYNRFIPACIAQITQRFEFNTAYTPYQPEISQGTLQSIYEYQSMICSLTGMDVANASVYDGATALAEAALMAFHINKINKILISNSINPEYKKVLETYCNASNLQLDTIENFSELDTLQTEYSAIIVQNPNYYGEIEDLEKIKEFKINKKTLFIVAQDILSLAILKPLSEYDADIVVGDIQSLGIPMNFGGAYGGFMACIDKYKRQLPGRIVGCTLDADGNQAFTLTLQAREQHIRREKATSNICSNQALVALASTIYMSVLGRNGLRQVAYLSSKNAHLLAKNLEHINIPVLNKNFFNEFVIKVDNADKFLEKMKEKNILAGIKSDANKILVCTTEINTEEDIQSYVQEAKNILTLCNA